MTTKEFSEKFDTMLNSFSSINDVYSTENISSIKLDEYEKSVFLTQAQLQLIKESYALGLEADEYTRSIIGSITHSAKTFMSSNAGHQPIVRNATIYKVNKKSLFTEYSEFPDPIKQVMETPMYTIREIVYDEISSKSYNVKPIRFDDLNKIIDNPFRFDLNSYVYRLDSSNVGELESEYNVILLTNIKNNLNLSYEIVYVKYPKPIILVELDNDLTIDGHSSESTSELNESCHFDILSRAVELAANRLGLSLVKDSQKQKNK